MKKFFALTMLAALALGLALPVASKKQAILNQPEPRVIVVDAL